MSEPYDGVDDVAYDDPDREANIDPGAPLDSQGIPDYADDASPERQELPEPQRFPTPTEAPTASVDFGTTAAEQRAGESLDLKLSREARDTGLDLAPDAATDAEPDPATGTGSEPDLETAAGPDLGTAAGMGDAAGSPSADEHSPYEREIPPAESDLAVHETLPGEIR